MIKSSLYYLVPILFVIWGCKHTPDPVPEPLAKPSNLVYSPNSITLAAGNAGSSAVPTVDGENITGYILVISPYSDKITVNSSGTIQIANNASAGTYVISVLVSNPTGTTTFDDIYTVTVNP